MKDKWLPVLATTGRIVTFRATREDILAFDGRHLAFGLLCVWLVGIGRTWDNPKAELLQRLGVGSVVYVFVLAFILWATINPFVKAPHLYKRILIVVCLSSPPGFIYAIPVEKFASTTISANINVTFLAIVASWRVALLIYYLRKMEGLSPAHTAVCTLLPLSTIMSGVTVFRVLDSIFTSMGGLHGGQRAADPVQAFWNTLGFIAVISFVPLMGFYVWAVSKAKFPAEN